MSQKVERDILTEPPGPSEPQTTRAARRPRPRRWLFWMVPAVGVVLLASVTFLARYQPLVPGSSAAGAGPGGRFSTPEFESDTVSEIAFKNGAVIGYGFTLRNDGPIGVTITSARPDSAGVLKCSASG